MMGRT